MPPSRPQAPADASASARWGWALLVLAIVLAYANTFSAPFVFDDIPTILENRSIRDLADLGAVLGPQAQGGLTVGGRPLVNLTLALNWAVGGDRVAGYHVVNLAIHVLAALTLAGLVRRTLAYLPSLAADAPRLGIVVAAVWALHPLQTESVTYIVQRAESLVGLFYLLTLYGFVRREEKAWRGLSVVACYLGMASKEVMVSAPLMVLLYDRTFVAGSFAAAWRSRRGYYAALAGSWLLLLALVASTAGRGGTAGFGTDIGVVAYAMTQACAIVRYLWLALWPGDLVFDYGIWLARDPLAVAGALALVALLVAATIWALVRRPRWGFAGAWFLALLAPSSSIVPVASQTMAEHRLYLALAALVAAAVCATQLRFGRRVLAGWIGVAVLLGAATWARNRTYASEEGLWRDAAAKWPANARAHNNLGHAVFKAGRIAESEPHYRRAIELTPTYPEPHYNLALTLARQGRLAEAIAGYEQALKLQPRYPEAHNNLGTVLEQTGRTAEAERHFREAARLKPDFAEPWNNLGNLLLQQGRLDEAVACFADALARKPDYAEVHYNWANALARNGRLAEAVPHYEAALKLKPDYVAASNNLGNTFLGLERLPEAVRQYEEAIRHAPDFVEARRNAALALLQAGRLREAAAHVEAWLRLAPADAQAREARDYLRSEGIAVR